MANGKIPLSKSEQDKIIRGIRSGQITLFDLPENLYEMYGEEMTEAVFKGLGTPPDVDLTLPDYKIERQLKENAYRFSSAKVFNYVNDTANALIDEKGMVRPFDDFKEIADGIGAQYNENWLKTEYETALNMADSAGKWRDIQQEKEIFPLLKYQTSEDAAVRKDHVKLNGIIKPVDDDFWKTYYPPNGWNCRCDAIQISEGKETDLRSNPPPKLDSKLFEGNAGKSGKIFTQKHPYFNVPKEFKEHKKNNFGLPLPQDITAPIKPTPSAFIPAKTIKEAEEFAINEGVFHVDYSKYSIDHANAMNEAIFNTPKGATPDFIGNFTYFKKITDRKFTRRQNKHNYGVSIQADIKIPTSQVTTEMRDRFKVFDITFGKTSVVHDVNVVGMNTTNYKKPIDIAARKREVNKIWKEKNGVKWSIGDESKFTHYHELGHIFDNKKTRPREFDALAKQWHLDTGIGHLKENRYGYTEAWADAFADWFLNKGANLPDNIKSLMKKKFENGD